MKVHGLRNDRGVLLLELLLGFFLLAFVVVSAAGLLIKTAQMAEDNKGRLLALQAAQSALETIKDTPLTSISSINTTDLIPTGLKQGALAIRTNPAIGTNTQIATITITVSWNGAGNRAQQLLVSTMKSRF